MKGLETPLTEYKLNYIYLNLDYINYVFIYATGKYWKIELLLYLTVCM